MPMTVESTDEMILADLLDVLCDFACDADQCLNPWPDETLAPLRVLAERLRRWHRTFTLGDHRPRPQSVTIDPVAVSAEDTTIALTDARYVMIGDLFVFGGEIMEVTAAPDLATNFVAVARGLRGTIATGHAPGTTGLLIGNTRTGRESAAERSRLVRENLDFTITAVPPAAAFIRPDTEDDADERERRRVEHEEIDAAIRRLEAETTAERAWAEWVRVGGDPGADCPLATVATPNLPPPAGHADCGCADDPARAGRVRGRVCPHCGTEQPPGVGWPATVVPRCLRCGGDIGRAGA
jgi:hypothetical protein